MTNDKKLQTTRDEVLGGGVEIFILHVHICLFSCTVSNSDYLASNRWIILNRKGHRRKRSWNKLSYTGTFLGRLEENHEKCQSGY